MTIYVPNLKGEILRLSDSTHSEIITKRQTAFHLTDGESEFTVEQIAVDAPRSKMGWLIYQILQILTQTQDCHNLRCRGNVKPRFSWYSR